MQHTHFFLLKLVILMTKGNKFIQVVCASGATLTITDTLVSSDSSTGIGISDSSTGIGQLGFLSNLIHGFSPLVSVNRSSLVDLK